MSATISKSALSDTTAPGVAFAGTSRLSSSGNWLDRLCRTAVQQQLSQLHGGYLNLQEQNRIDMYGHQAHDGLAADLTVHDSKFFRNIVAKGGLGLAESYLQGQWTSPDVTACLRVLCRNMDRLNSANHGVRRPGAFLDRLTHFLRGNSVRGSRRNIAAHYDLSNDFFALFLDPTLTYSAGYFATPETDLQSASIAKYERLCKKLNLSGSDRLLEIGTGWGGFAIHAADRYRCQITTTTISDNQYETAQARVAAAGLKPQVCLLKSDYRELRGQFDKLVSIEMIESVGQRFLDLFLGKCNQLLKPGGRFVMQAIVMPERRYDSYRRSVDYIQKYIFPGGFLPSVAAICQSIGRTGNLQMTDVEDISPHYARTLAHWRTNFLSRLQDVRRLGFDDRFIRMWQYYLCYCEAAFAERAVQVVHMSWEKPKT